MIRRAINFLLLLSAFIVSVYSYGSVPEWTIKPAESSLTFTATQNGAPVSGQFKTFSGDIHFDPNQLGASNVNIAVEIGSINDAYNKLTDTLKSKDWFDEKAFPQAVFKSSQFKKVGDKKFESNGTLTIRDKTLPVTLDLTLEEYGPTNAKMKGSTVIKRTDFGVGQGEWADTKLIKNEVRINFMVTATKK